MTAKFKINDEVYVSNPQLASYREVGVVRNVFIDINGKITYDVGFIDLHKVLTIAERNLEKFNPDDSPTEGDDSMYHLAYVYYHDADDNPSSMEEAVESFDLHEANDVVYGTKEDILQKIKESCAICAYDNGFIIMDGKLYNINTTVSVEW